MSLRDELQSVTPEEAHWAMLSFFEQGATATEAGHIEESIESRTQTAERDYPGIVSLSNLVLEATLKSEALGSYSNQQVLVHYSQFMLLALAQVVEIREKSERP